jgi:Spy/CpxP family protein refolding chaperone
MRTVTFRVLIITTLGAALAAAQAPGKPKEKLNLTPEQRSQARAIFAQTKRDTAPLKQELKQNRRAMTDAIRSGKSETEIRQLAAAQGNTLGQIIALRSQARARFVAQLTPEQKAALGQRGGKALGKLGKRKSG